MKRKQFEDALKDLPGSFDKDAKGNYLNSSTAVAYRGWCAAMKQGDTEGYLIYSEVEPDKHLKMLCLQRPKNIPAGLTIVPLKRKST